MKISLQDLKARFHAPTPAFWKSIQRKMGRLAASALTASGTLYTANAITPMPGWIIPVCQYLAVFGAGFPAIVTAVAQFTCEDPRDKQV